MVPGSNPSSHDRGRGRGEDPSPLRLPERNLPEEPRLAREYAARIRGAVGIQRWGELSDVLQELKSDIRISNVIKRGIVNALGDRNEGTTCTLPPLAIYLGPDNSNPRTKTVSLFLELGANPQALGLHDRSLVDLALDHGSFGPALRLIEAGAPVPERFAGQTYEIRQHKRLRDVDFRELLAEMVSLTSACLRQRRPNFDAVIEEVKEIIAVHRNVYHGYRHLRAYYEGTHARVPELHDSQNGLFFTRNLPALLFSYDPDYARDLVQAIDKMSDANPHLWEYGYHPNEAELLALLHHPRLDLSKENHQEMVESLILALTSIVRYRYKKEGNIETVRPGTESVWGKIGFLTFCHQFWHFDTENQIEVTPGGEIRRIGPSLIEQSGFDLVRNRASDKKRLSGILVDDLGKGFVLSDRVKNFSYPSQTLSGATELVPFDERTYVEFRRSYILVSHPEYGTLIVRNSSPNFGRHAFAHSAYWSPNSIGNGFTLEELQNIRDPIDLRFYPILHPTVYLEGIASEPSKVEMLADLAIAAKDYHRAWKYDTNRHSAFTSMTNPLDETQTYSILQGGHLSTGFLPLVEALERRAQALSRVRPGMRGRVTAYDLAFVNPYYSPWSPERFTAPTGELATRIKTTPEVLGTIGKLARKEFRQSDCAVADRSGLTAFFQMGMATESELILLPSRPDRELSL